MSRLPSLVTLLALALLGACATAPVAPAVPAAPARAAVPLPAAPARPHCAVPQAAVTTPSAAAMRTGPPAPRPGPPPAEMVANARWHRAAGDRAAALAWLETAAVQAPDDAEVCFELADLLVAGETELDWAGAMLLAIPAGHPRRDGTLGRLAELRGDLETAQAAYGRQLAVADDRDLRLRRALALERLGRDAEAVPELERLRAAEPSSVPLRARLAERYEAAGRLGEAEAELRALAALGPGRPEGWRRLAAFCGRHGLAEQARAAEARVRETAGPPPRELRPLLPTGR